ncbi:Staphylococcal nuclease like protein [Plasmodiophora brassicae]
MSAPTPVDVQPVAHMGPSVAEIAGRVVNADPVAQAKISFGIHQKHVANTPAADEKVDAPDASAAPAGNVILSGLALVKSVPSADTLVLVGAATADRPPPEKTLILSGLVVPKLGRKKGAVDEPFAWEAKEYLRRLVIGKRVKFAVTYTHAESQRDYGTAELEGVGDLSENLVKNGWARVKPAKEGMKPKPELEPLIAAQAEAEAAHKGVHAAKPAASAVRKVEYLTTAEELREFFNANRGKALQGIVDQVREGSSLRIEVPGKAHTIFMVHLAGAQAPRIPLGARTGAATSKDKPEEWAVEAQAFTAARLLNRDVTVTLFGCDKFGNLFGTVSVTQGDIAVALLKHGLAKYIDWSAALAPNKSDLAVAEAAAKAQKLRLWKKFTAPEPVEDVRGKEFTGKVVQVVNADVIVVEDSAKKEHRLSLASIRAPRLPFRDREGDLWSVEAKEWVRKRLIGKKVRVCIDYVRKPSADARDQDERVFASVFQGKENIAEVIVSLGFAEVVKHRMDDERSAHYESLQAAESKAAAAKKGIHGSKPASQPMVDLSEKVRVPAKNPTEEQLRKQRDHSMKTNQFFSSVQRAGKVKAVVEYVFNGGRVKLFVPSMSHIFTFMLAGIRLPSGKGETPNPLAAEVNEFIRSKIFQQDVEVEVQSMEKGENFVGALFFERKNLALQLLERGYAHVMRREAERSPYSAELISFEQAAQKARVGIWKDWDPDAERKKAEERDRLRREQEKEEERSAAQEQQTAATVQITELFDPTNFYFQDVKDANVAKVRDALAALPSSSAAFTPKRGDFCLAQFDDGTWCRAKVDKIGLGGRYLVNFIDYGNHAEVTSVRPVPEGVPALRVPPLAKHATLSGIALSKDYLDDAMALFAEQAWTAHCTAHIDAVDRERGIAHVTLTPVNDPATGKPSEKALPSVNEVLLRHGVVRVPSRPARGLRKVLDKLKAAEAEAKAQHAGIWTYGDVSSDEDEDNPKRR